MIAPSSTIRFGTRGSALARAQTDLVIDRMRLVYPELTGRPVVIRTEGDRDKLTPLSVIGGQGVFTTALQEALRWGRIDAAVHSAKDLPTDRPHELILAAFMAREDPRDVFVSRHGCPLVELDSNPLIGTSSRRRAVQVRRLRPDARIVDLRGNIDTRLRKAVETDLDGIVLAAAGVRRMGWADRITEYLPLEIAVPSPGQGALAVEIRADEAGPAHHLAELDEIDVSTAVKVERAFLRGVAGGCSMPVGALATVVGGEIRLLGMIADDDGDRVEWVDVRFGPADAEDAARRLAAELLGRVRRRSQAVHNTEDRRLKPLSGKRVLITRGGEDDPLARLIAARGGEPVVLPTSRIEGPDDPAALNRAVERLEAGVYDWVVFTSGHAVEQVVARLRSRASSTANRAKVAAVGPATAERLEASGIAGALVPPRHCGEALVEALVDAGVRGATVLFPRGNLARDTVPRGLARAGAQVDEVEAYRTVAVDELDPDVQALVQERPIDVAIFLSPSSLHNLAALMGGRLDLLEGAVVACIGPVTADAARAMGLSVPVVSREATIDATVEAVERYLTDVVPTEDLAGERVEHRSSLR